MSNQVSFTSVGAVSLPDILVSDGGMEKVPWLISKLINLLPDNQELPVFIFQVEQFSQTCLWQHTIFL
jgi:hypothetical protein